jgi:hypothetical protein
MKKYIGNNTNWMIYNKPKPKPKTINDLVARAIGNVCNSNSVEEFRKTIHKAKEDQNESS